MNLWEEFINALENYYNREKIKKMNNLIINI